MTWHPILILGRFLSPTSGFVGVPGIATTLNEYRVSIGEEPFRFPYLARENPILFSNVLRGAETPTIVGSCEWFLKLDKRITFHIVPTCACVKGYNVVRCGEMRPLP